MSNEQRTEELSALTSRALEELLSTYPNQIDPLAASIAFLCGAYSPPPPPAQFTPEGGEDQEPEPELSKRIREIGNAWTENEGSKFDGAAVLFSVLCAGAAIAEEERQHAAASDPATP